MEQLSFSFRAASEEVERKAIEWQVRRLLQAETRCGNELACRQPQRFIENFTKGILASESASALVVTMYEIAKRDNLLDEPIWAEWMWKKPKFEVARHG